MITLFPPKEEQSGASKSALVNLFAEARKTSQTLVEQAIILADAIKPEEGYEPEMIEDLADQLIEPSLGIMEDPNAILGPRMYDGLLSGLIQLIIERRAMADEPDTFYFALMDAIAQKFEDYLQNCPLEE